MQRSQFKIELKYINDLSVQNAKVIKGKENFKDEKNVKSTREIKKYFDGFKRAMKFGLCKF